MDSPKKHMNKNLATTWSREDRDLLVELRTDMKAVREDIKTFTDNTNRTTSDHEQRLRVMEAQSNKWLGKESLVGGAVGILASLAVTFFK